MSVLVTGGSGFVGAYLARDLLAEGRDVVVYDHAPNSNVLDLLGHAKQVETVRGEIADGWALLRACQRYRVQEIVHLASPLTQDVAAAPAAGVRDVCLGMVSVLEAARACGVRRVAWASSVAVFGASSSYPPGPITGDACHRPLNLYGACKSLCEATARQYATEEGVDSVGLRLSVVYGAGRLRGYMSYPSHLAREVALGRPARIEAAGQLLHWQYVEEVSAMLRRGLAHPDPCGGVTYNGYGDSRTFGDAAKILRDLAPGADIQVADGTDEQLAHVACAYDDTDFRRDLGYEPTWPLERGLAATLAGYRRMAEHTMTVSA